MKGWIKIHRKITEHWIWKDEMYLKAWLAILLAVNHEDSKSLIQGELIECKRGQSLMSLQSWVKLFGKHWTLQRVRTFFNLLKDDQMINTEGLRKTTRLTVCNYDNYQFEQQTNNRQTTDKQQADNTQITTNKKNKNDKKKKKSMPNKSADFIDMIISEFINAHGNYVILNPGKERAAASKILEFHKEKFPGANSEETLTALSKYFNACVNIDDPWLRQNMSLSIIVSKFNEINTIIRNGKAKRNSKAPDGSTVEDVIADQARKLGIVQ